MSIKQQRRTKNNKKAGNDKDCSDPRKDRLAWVEDAREIQRNTDSPLLLQTKTPLGTENNNNDGDASDREKPYNISNTTNYFLDDKYEINELGSQSYFPDVIMKQNRILYSND